MPAFSLERVPPLGYPATSPPARRSPTQHTPITGTIVYCHDFGGVLEPRYIVGAESLDQ